MSVAPYQLWIDAAPISSAVRVSSTVTITTVSAHGLQTGAYVQLANLTGQAGTTMNGVFQITRTSGSAFTFSQAGSAGTATSGSAAISYDLLAPLDNYAAGTARQYAANADISSTNLVANGDGSGASMSTMVLQENTPADGAFMTLLPDQTRIRFALKETGGIPSATDILFLGYLNAYTLRLNGSGLGSIADLNLHDVNTLLDRVMVMGKSSSSVGVKGGFGGGGPERNNNVVTLTTRAAHGFGVGQVITVVGVPGGGSVSFNGTFTIASVPSTTKLTYAQTGPDYSNNQWTGAINYTISLDGLSRTSVIFNTFTSDSAYVNEGAPVAIYKGACRAVGFTNANGVESLIFSSEPNQAKIHPAYAITKLSDTSFRLRLPSAITEIVRSGKSFSGPCGVIQSTGAVYDAASTNGQTAIVITGNTTETNAVKQMLARVNSWHSDDYPLQRLLDTTGTANISGGSAYKPSEAIYLPSTSLRSTLDTIVETYQSDTRLRRYYINPQGKLVYSLTDADAVPTYATAPYKLIVTGAGSPNVTASAATIAPFNLTVTYDHDMVKRAQFNIPSDDNGGQINTIFTYTDPSQGNGGTAAVGTAVPLYTERPGAPIMETIVDFPNGSKSLMEVAAAAWFKERHQPMLSGFFELRGSGTAAHNINGFLQGYYQTGASTFALGAWAPGQFVDITAAGLGLSGKYRIEQVSLSFERASYKQIIGVTFNRKNPADLASIIAAQRS